jgi:hypothetical protein
MNPIRFMAESKNLAIAFGISNKNHSSLAVIGNKAFKSKFTISLSLNLSTGCEHYKTCKADLIPH